MKCISFITQTFLLKSECIYAEEQFTYAIKQQAYVQEASSHQYNSMLIVHALKLDPEWGHMYTHTHKRIHGHTGILTKMPTPLLSGFY